MCALLPPSPNLWLQGPVATSHIIIPETGAKQHKLHKQPPQPQATATATSHLSAYAVEQLTAAGVSPQLLQRIQSSTADRPSTTRPGTRPETVGADSTCPESGNLQGSQCTSARSRAAFRKAAHLLRVRQEHILQRIGSLETDAAQSSCLGKRGGQCSLQWESVAPNLQVRWSLLVTSGGCKAYSMSCR